MESIKAVILLATYNGAPFLAELIDSLLAQSHQDILVLIRDDGSSDETPAIIRSYCACHPQKLVDVTQLAVSGSDFSRTHFTNPAAGIVESDQSHSVVSLRKPLHQEMAVNSAAKSFSVLLEYLVTQGEQYGLDEYCVLFADQDDYWHPSKISKMLPLVAGDEPTLAHCDLSVVDENRQLLAGSLFLTQNLRPDRIGLNQLLVQNCVTGCAVIMNRALVELIAPIPQAALMHDGWAALVAAATGHIRYCDEPLVEYRQHEANSIGATFYGAAYILKKLAGAMVGQSNRVTLTAMIAQASELLSRCDDRLTSADRSVLQDFVQLPALASPLSRFQVIRRHKIFRHGLLRNAMLIVDLLRLPRNVVST